jgi:hypothetical protein
MTSSNKIGGIQQYAVFGKVTKGDETLSKLEEVPTRREGIFVMVCFQENQNFVSLVNSWISFNFGHSFTISFAADGADHDFVDILLR